MEVHGMMSVKTMSVNYVKIQDYIVLLATVDGGIVICVREDRYLMMEEHARPVSQERILIQVKIRTNLGDGYDALHVTRANTVRYILDPFTLGKIVFQDHHVMRNGTVGYETGVITTCTPRQDAHPVPRASTGFLQEQVVRQDVRPAALASMGLLRDNPAQHRALIAVLARLRPLQDKRLNHRARLLCVQQASTCLHQEHVLIVKRESMVARQDKQQHHLV